MVARASTQKFGGDPIQFITTHKEILCNLKKEGDPGTCYHMGESWGHYHLLSYTEDLYDLILEPGYSPAPGTLTHPNHMPSCYMPLHTSLLSLRIFFLHFSHQREFHPLFQAYSKCCLQGSCSSGRVHFSFYLCSASSWYNTLRYDLSQPAPSTNHKLPKAHGSSSCHLFLAQSLCTVDTL